MAFTLPGLSLTATPKTTAWTGAWEATASNDALTVAFHFQIVDGKHGIEGLFFNGDEPVVSNRAKLDGDHRVLRYDAFDRVLDLQQQADGSFASTHAPVSATAKAKPWTIAAHREDKAAVADEGAPKIGGLWIVPSQSKKIAVGFSGAHSNSATDFLRSAIASGSQVDSMSPVIFCRCVDYIVPR